jgi:hypothetical protein
MKRPNKFHAVRTEIDGITFASKGEARRYQELKLLERVGQIRDLTRQPWFALQVPPHWKSIGKYVADFSYLEGDDLVIEDFKGVMTPLSRWKIAHVNEQYQTKVRITGRAQRRQRGR